MNREEERNETFERIRSKRAKILTMAFIPLQRLLAIMCYSKAYQALIKVSIDDYKYVFNYLKKLTSKERKADAQSNESSKQNNIKLRLMMDKNSSSFSFLNHNTLCESSMNQISSVLILKDERVVLGTNKGELLRSSSNTVKTFDEVIKAHQAKITCLIQLDDDSIASASLDKWVKVYDLKRFDVLYSIEFIKPVHCLIEFSPGLLIAGSNELVVLNIKDKEDHTLKEHYGTVYSLMKANKADLIVGSSKLKVIRFINNKAMLYCNSHQDIKVFEGNAFSVKALLLLKANRIASAENAVIAIWDMTTERLLRRLQGHSKSILTMETIDENSFASAGEDCMIIIWNLKDFSQSRLIYTCFDSSMIKIVYTRGKELLLFLREGNIIILSVEKTMNEDEEGVFFDFYDNQGKFKRMLSISNAFQLKYILNEETYYVEDEEMIGFAP